jgi:single-stranded-DNA-specific exonuclease
MAAGLTIMADDIPALAAFLDERLATTIDRAREDRALLVDAVLAPGGVNPDLVRSLDGAGPYGAGWPAPRVAAGPFRLVKVDTVGNGHIRAIAAGDDGRSIKAMAFRAADTPLGQALLAAPPHRRLWLAGRAKLDEWGSRPAAELHLDDAAWAD